MKQQKDKQIEEIDVIFGLNPETGLTKMAVTVNGNKIIGTGKSTLEAMMDYVRKQQQAFNKEKEEILKTIEDRAKAWDATAFGGRAATSESVVARSLLTELKAKYLKPTNNEE